MRGSSVRSAIVSAIEGITPGSMASKRDRFRELKQGYREQHTPRDRLFALRMSVPPGRSQELITTDLYVVEFDLAIFYADAPGDLVEDRIAHDCEQVVRRLESLPSEQTQLEKIDTIPGTVDEMDGIVSAVYTLIVNYRLTGVS